MRSTSIGTQVQRETRNKNTESMNPICLTDRFGNYGNSADINSSPFLKKQKNMEFSMKFFNKKSEKSAFGDNTVECFGNEQIQENSLSKIIEKSDESFGYSKSEIRPKLDQPKFNVDIDTNYEEKGVVRYDLDTVLSKNNTGSAMKRPPGLKYVDKPYTHHPHEKGTYYR